MPRRFLLLALAAAAALAFAPGGLSPVGPAAAQYCGADTACWVDHLECRLRVVESPAEPPLCIAAGGATAA